MKARYPKIDYANVKAHWAPNWEFAHNVNASSTIPVFVEPWLIKVFNRAKQKLPAKYAELHRQIDIFIAQESQHYRQHAGFNRRIREEYPAMMVHEKRIEQEYEEMLEKRSLKFCLAYSEGFESLGPPAAKMWFEEFEPFLEGADYEAVALWKWHMAEEHEHRSVCHNLFMALYARTLWGKIFNGWLYRCYGFLVVVRHLGNYTKRVARELIDTDRKTMTPEQLEQSKANEAAVVKIMKHCMQTDMIKVLSPFYHPSQRLPPRGMEDYLDRFDKGGDMGRPVAA